MYILNEIKMIFKRLKLSDNENVKPYDNDRNSDPSRTKEFKGLLNFGASVR